jgi:4-amino-4-deoxy-L-arabinose transferase
MPIYTEQLWPAILIASLPAIVGIVWFTWFGKERLGLWLLVLSALMIRLVLISGDPFLQEWDERFHALVAKHMMDNPFAPMLRLTPIFAYDPSAWCCNHIWVHKQPLFLWQMAVSMKLFGVTEFATRVPSAVRGAIQVLFVFNIAKFWMRDSRTAFLAALLCAFAFFQIELSTGRYLVDHNDIAFTFYMTAGIWGFTKYVKSQFAIKWVLITGALIGCAVLVKWLTAFLLVGGWGLYIIFNPELRKQRPQYAKLALAIFVACCVFVPWQLYIIEFFPIEAAAAYAHNRMHITEVLGEHSGSILYFLSQLPKQYGLLFIPFLIIGIIRALTSAKVSKSISLSFVAMILVLFGFFSLIVVTKIPAYTYPVQALMLTLIAFGIMLTFDRLTKTVRQQRIKHLIIFIVMLASSFHALTPLTLVNHRSRDNAQRNAKIENTRIYRQLSSKLPTDIKIINCKSFEDVEVMFYTNFDAYHWWPEERVLDSLQLLGYRFAAFTSHTNQHLPEYITQDTSIMLIQDELK